MKLKVLNIDWGRYRYELPSNDIVEVPGDWRDWFSTDNDVERLRKEVIRQLRAKHGVTPRAWIFE